MGYRDEDLHKVNERDSHKTFALQLQHTSMSLLRVPGAVQLIYLSHTPIVYRQLARFLGCVLLHNQQRMTPLILLGMLSMDKGL